MKPKRIQRKRTKGWKMPPNTVCVNRPSKWGNPLRVTDRQTIDRVMINYRQIAESRAVEIRADLRGKNLACFCQLCDRHKDGKPLGDICTDCSPCHTDVLLEIANA